MSFSSQVKGELCRTALSRRCCAQAEAYGVLLYCNQFTGRQVRITTESAPFAARLPALFQKAFQVSFDRLPEEGESGKLVFQITDGGKLRRIVDLLGFSPEQNLALHINFCRRRGRENSSSPSPSRTSCPPCGRLSAMSRRGPWPTTSTSPCWRRSTAAWHFSEGPFWRGAR